MGLFASLRRSRSLARLSQALSPIAAPLNLAHMGALKAGLAQRKDALERLLDFCETDDACAPVLSCHGIGRDTLRDLYSFLEEGGAGVQRQGYYVPVLVLAYPKLLEYALAARETVPIQELCYELVRRVDAHTFH